MRAVRMAPRWVRPTVERDYFISGGHLTSPMPVRAMTVSGTARATPKRSTDAPLVEGGPGHDGGAGATADFTNVFVKLDTSAGWLVKALGRATAQNERD